VYAYRIAGSPRRQAEEITTLQYEHAEAALRETIGQRAAAESGADHYRIITLHYRRVMYLLVLGLCVLYLLKRDSTPSQQARLLFVPGQKIAQAKSLTEP
jgi:hypothetical protein